MRHRLLLSALIFGFSVSCAQTQPRDVSYFKDFGPGIDAKPVIYNNLKGWQNEDFNGADDAFRNSCEAMRKAVETKEVLKFRKICEQSSSVNFKDPKQVRAFFEAHFVPYEITARKSVQVSSKEGLAVEDRSGDADPGKFTGYYQPVVKGSLTKTSKYQTPLYGYSDAAAEKAKKVPNLTREQIAEHGPGVDFKPILWLENPIEAFFLQVQGSGVVQLEDGKQITLGFASKTEKPYTSIGGYMVKQGLLKAEEVSMQTIKAWLLAHPERQAEILNQNESFVFFRVQASSGAVGSLGVKLTKKRSIAVDKKYIPLGFPIWLQTSGLEMNRLMFAQDTGSAIKGPIRGDVFWGIGDDAAVTAGKMNEQGQIFVLLPKP